MKKETFIVIVKAIQEQYQRETEFGSAWEKFTGDYLTCMTGTMFDQIIDAIDDEFDTDMLGWWLWDAPNGIQGEPAKDGVLRDTDGNDIDVSTVDKLYDYLVSQKETK